MSAQKPINCQNGQINFVEMTKNIPSPQEEYPRSSPSSFVQNGQNIQKANKQQTIVEQDPQPQRVSKTTFPFNSKIQILAVLPTCSNSR